MWKGNHVEELGDNRYLVRTRPSAREPHDREVLVEVGKRYIVVPINPNKLQNRNRECIFISGHGTSAKVEFVDTGKTTKVDFDDLTELTELERIIQSAKMLEGKRHNAATRFKPKSL